jgi:hypothetical protein
MKRLTVVLLTVVVAVLLASPISSEGQGESGQRKQSGQNEQAGPATGFVEEPNIPDGKALIYIYQPGNPVGFASAWTPLLLAKDGPLGILPPRSYYSYLTDPGTIKFWLAASESRELKVEAVAGQIYYVKGRVAGNGQGMMVELLLQLMPRETAIKEIVWCQPLSD